MVVVAAWVETQFECQLKISFTTINKTKVKG
jgi:hypothetical protein